MNGIQLPFIGPILPSLPPLSLQGLPSGVALYAPGQPVNQPGQASVFELINHTLVALNNFSAAAVTNPLFLLASPITTPVALANQLTPKLQAGSLNARTTSVSTAVSGAYIPLQPQPTLITEGQLYNPNTAGSAGGGPSGATIAITTPAQGSTTPDPGATIPIAPGGTFNFGPVDLGQIYVVNQSDMRAVPLKLYIEQ